MRAHEIVDQRIARTGVAGDWIAAVDKGDVSETAYIEHLNWMWALEIARQRLMERRHQRPALSAGGDIGGAKIMGHRQSKPARQRRAVANLHGQPRGRSVQHGLAVKPDNGDAGFIDIFGCEKGFHRLGMDAGHEGIGLCQHARPRRARSGRHPLAGHAATAPAHRQNRAGSRSAQNGRCARRLSQSAPRRRRRARCRSSAQLPLLRPNPSPFFFTPDLLHQPRKGCDHSPRPSNERL